MAWGYIDRTGKMVLPAQYDHALSFSEGLAGVSIDGKYGFIDQTEKMIMPRSMVMLSDSPKDWWR